jgi:8-oxo-dGTP pyrophosphatase MutT (NUDIX family)
MYDRQNLLYPNTNFGDLPRGRKFSCFFCNDLCCKFISKEYIKPNIVWDKKDNNRRAGVLVIDSEKKYMLMVQSCGFLWGPPKGVIEPGESEKDAAIRELREETGIIINSEDLGAPLYTSVGVYFIYVIKKRDLCIPTNISNEITGIGWVSFNCLLKYYITFSEIINSPAKKLLSKSLFILGYTKNKIKFPERRCRNYENNFINYNVFTLVL